MELLRGGASRLRALATECMPFELPLEASRPWLYEWLDSRVVALKNYKVAVVAKSRKDLLLLALIGTDKNLPVFASADCLKSVVIDGEAASGSWRAPASFLVRRNRIQTRRLDLLSASSQLAIAFVYGNHKEELLYFGNRSKSSLRYPARTTSPGKHLKSRFKDAEAGREVSIETRGRILGTYNSYFAYERYAFIGEFYDSRRWHALEGHWRFLRRLDVSNCFGSIYTHSFGWATSTDAHSKAHLGPLNKFTSSDVGRIFDKVMQSSNWGETHGVCVGPESSRVFAEVIFQKIDLDIERQLRAVRLTSRDYEILRYVDDYFVFVHNLSDLDKIELVINDVLTRTGFTLNSSKTRNYTTPFTTIISQKKASLKVFLKLALPLEGDLPRYDMRDIGVQLRSTMIASDNDAHAIGAALTQVERQLRRFMKRRASKCGDFEQAQELMSYVWGFAHSMLYQYLSNPSVSSSMKMVRTLRDVRRASALCTKLSQRSRRMLDYDSSESLHFAISRAIRRLSGVSNSEIEICHFLSLASASGLTIAAGSRVFFDLCQSLRGHLASHQSPRSNQAGIFLLLSTMKYFLPEGRSNADESAALMVLCRQFADLLFDSQYLPTGKIVSHAAQELLFLALLECPFIGTDEKFGLLCKPWVLNLICSHFSLQGDDPRKSARRFLKRCVEDERYGARASSAGSILSTFVWSDEDFDDLLYEKEPQFIY